MSEERVSTEKIEITGHEVMEKVKRLLHEGNVRRITVRNREGGTVLDLPLTVGVVGAVLAPTLTAVGAIVALAAHGSIVVEKVEPPAPPSA